MKELSEDEVDTFILAGITPLETVNGTVEVIRAVTTRTVTDGALDKTFRELGTVLIIDYVISSIRMSLKERLKSFRNNGMSRGAIRSQAAIILSEIRDAGLIASFEPPVVEASQDDSTVCIVLLSFDVAVNINQIHIYARIGV
jgi:hypothetical protein